MLSKLYQFNLKHTARHKTYIISQIGLQIVFRENNFSRSTSEYQYNALCHANFDGINFTAETKIMKSTKITARKDFTPYGMLSFICIACTSAYFSVSATKSYQQTVTKRLPYATSTYHKYIPCFSVIKRMRLHLQRNETSAYQHVHTSSLKTKLFIAGCLTAIDHIFLIEL